MELENHFINTVVRELDHLNGTEFETLCLFLLEILTGKEFELKGHNLEMKPVRGSVDLVQNEDYLTIGQCGTDKDYFSGSKPVDDINSSIKNSPNFQTIYLFSNRKATGKELQTVNKAITDKLNELTKTYKKAYTHYLYDSQRIAETILNNIHYTEKIEKILSYLPLSGEYYKTLPKTNLLPLQHKNYKHRTEEAEVVKLLDYTDFLQIYGLSGIGKSQLTIAIANNLYKEFNTVLWLDEKNLISKDLKNVRLRRMGEDIDLANLLNTFKVLIIIDNLNDDVRELMNNFRNYNKKGSKCIVSSLQRNVGPDNSYNLTYVSSDISREILLDCPIPPTDEQLDSILSNITGYPLLLELSKNAVADEEMTWDDVINESNLTGIDDKEKNITFASRIVGRYKEKFKGMFNLIYGLNTTTISKLFLREKGLMEFRPLINTAILQDFGDYECRIHQVVLSAISTIFSGDYSKKDFSEYLLRYLENHVPLRDEGFFTFIFLHKDRLRQIASGLSPDDLLRHYIVLSDLYSGDAFSNPSRYLHLIDDLKLSPEETEIDFSLYIERMELDQKQSKPVEKCDENEKDYEEKIRSDIETLKGIKCLTDKSEAIKYHHIGKWLSYIEDYEHSEPYLRKALELNPKSYNSMLRLARDYRSKSVEKTTKEIESILNKETIKEVPISIRLGAYDIICNYKYKELRKKYIDNELEQFSRDIYSSLSESYSHPYVILAKLAEHLAFNYTENYVSLCNRLPLPLNIERNHRLMKDYGKIKLAQYIYGKAEPEEKKRIFKTVEDCLSSVPKEDDYLRKDKIKLYLAAEMPDKALQIALKIEKKDEKFNQQTLCKVYLENGQIDIALDYIEKAIAQEDPREKEYCAAFRHDKARCLHRLNDPKAKEIMTEAINMQPSETNKNLWRKELGSWETTSD